MMMKNPMPLCDAKVKELWTGKTRQLSDHCYDKLVSIKETFHTCFFIEDFTAVLVTSKEIFLLRPKELTTVFSSDEERSLAMIKPEEEINPRANAMFYFAITDASSR